jgi:dGTPase
MAVGLARILKVNEDLAQTIALAHDLGHPPFGHPGETVLNELMKDEGGFEHNVQGYKVVTELEERYPHFSGLNLSYEVLEGIIRHTTDYDTPHGVKDFQFYGYPTIEAQIVNYADQIAFMNHDLDDGLHWGMLTMDSLKEVELWAETFSEVSNVCPDATERVKRCRTISNVIDKMIGDLQAETKKRISGLGIKKFEDVRTKGKDVVSFSEEMKRKTSEAKKFLLNNVYHYKDVVEMRKVVDTTIKGLFKRYTEDPKKLPEKYLQRAQKDGIKRAVCDYIAGMTDRFAIQIFTQQV